MASSCLRVLLLADTHLGLDLPVRPRIERRRRGADFFANTVRALQPALRGEVDLVVHGGDLLFRSRVPPDLVQRAMAPLFEVADAGVPVYLVPGNHERGRIPYPLLARHPLPNSSPLPPPVPSVPIARSRVPSPRAVTSSTAGVPAARVVAVTKAST